MPVSAPLSDPAAGPAIGRGALAAGGGRARRIEAKKHQPAA